MNRVIVIGGGSFQGKSLLALHIGNMLKIPCIICTDTIRNVLRILNPAASYLSTSTYLLSPKDLERQMKEISAILRKLLSIYDQRGESVIIEGMHLSQDFIKYLSTKSNVLIFCLNNTLPLKKRLEYKSIVRNKVEYYDPKMKKVIYGYLTKNNLRFTPYMRHSRRIEEIHRNIVNYFSQLNLPIIDFNDLDVALDRVNKMIYYRF